MKIGKYTGSAGLKCLDIEDTKAFWYRTNRLIKEKKLTQRIVANRCDTFESTFKNWSHTKTYPRVHEIYLISQVLGVSMNYLLFGQETEPRTEFEYIIGKKVLSLVESVTTALNNKAGDKEMLGAWAEKMN